MTVKPKPTKTERYETLKKRFWNQGDLVYGYEYGTVWETYPTKFKGWFVRFYSDKTKTVHTHLYRSDERAKEDALLFKLKHGLEGKEL